MFQKINDPKPVIASEAKQSQGLGLLRFARNDNWAFFYLEHSYAPIARAIAAQAMFISEQQEKFPPILTDAQLRDKVVELLTLALGEAELGLGGWLLMSL